MSAAAAATAARSLARVLRRIRAAVPPPPELPPPPWCCCDCGRDTHAASVADPARCGDCARTRYAWRPATFGKLRKVPPVEAARWTD